MAVFQHEGMIDRVITAEASGDGRHHALPVHPISPLTAWQRCQAHSRERRKGCHVRDEDRQSKQLSFTVNRLSAIFAESADSRCDSIRAALGSFDDAKAAALLYDPFAKTLSACGTGFA